MKKIIGLTLVGGGQCALIRTDDMTLESVTDALDKAVEESLEKSYSDIPWVTFAPNGDDNGDDVGDLRVRADQVTSVWYGYL